MSAKIVNALRKTRHTEVDMEVSYEVKPGIYRHYKGKFYRVFAVATHSETGERLVVYRPEYGERRIKVRPEAMFVEEVDMPEYEYIGPRFMLVKEELFAFPE